MTKLWREPNIKVNLLFTLFFAVTIAGFLAVGQEVHGQNVQPKYKVGDRVEFSMNGACLGEQFAIPAKGTIKQINTTSQSYVIQVDGRQGDVSRPIYTQECGFRALAAPPPDPKPVDPRNNGDGQVTPNPRNGDQQNGPAKYKAGDRVELSLNGACLGEQFAVPVKGTILQVNLGTVMNYVVQVDPRPGEVPRIVSRPIYTQDCGFRPLGGAGPEIKTDRLRVDKENTVLADRELLDCDNLKHGGKNGDPPPVALLKKLVQCLLEKPSNAGQDGAERMNLTEFTIGTPHKWRTYIDQGQGTLNTNVYPVHIKFDTKKFFYERNDEVVGREETVTCFADADNLWQCGWASGPHKEGKKQEYVVKR